MLEWLHRVTALFRAEIGHLVAVGTPSDDINDWKLRPEYIKLGYKLFRDHERLHAKFLTADILDDNSSLARLRGEFSLVYAASFPHF
jgi:hypothetical protein